MIDAKQLKAIAAFIKKDGVGASGGLSINFDKSELFACNGSNAVLIELVDGLEGSGNTVVPLDVVKSAIILISDKHMTASREDFCGIPFEPIVNNLFNDYRRIFELSDIRLPGRPGLYKSSSLKLIEGLDKAFKGPGEFYLPSAPDKPLIFEIGLSQDFPPEDQREEDWRAPTEMVKAAIMPIKDPPIKNTWDGILTQK